MEYEGAKALVLGMGRSGAAAVELLTELGAAADTYDDKGSVTANTYDPAKEYDICIVSPGIPLTHQVLKDCRRRKFRIMSELEFGCSLMDNRIVAITGTNGKTTVTMMVTEILKAGGFKARAMGNIGVPVTACARKMEPGEIAVIEVSSFQLETTMRFNPEVAAITNIAPDHLDRHGDYETYIGCKLSMFCRLNGKNRAVINYDSRILREFSLSLFKVPVTFFSTEYKVKGCYLESDRIYCGEYVCDVEDLALKEPHNVENALCAIAVCIPMGVAPEAAREALMRFEPAHYRMADRGIKHGKRWYNDSKGTNIHATLAACRAVNGATALILGGSDKGEDYTELFEGMPINIRFVLVSGDNASSIMTAAAACRFYTAIECPSLKDCVERAKALEVDNVLFSPASASFDRFSNYEERGGVFDSLIC